MSEGWAGRLLTRACAQRDRRLARLGEEPEHEDPLPPTYNGRPWTLADILRSGRTRAVGRQHEPANEDRLTETP